MSEVFESGLEVFESGLTVDITVPDSIVPSNPEDPYFYFTHWSGDCGTYQDNPINIAVDANKDIVANYSQYILDPISVSEVQEIKYHRILLSWGEWCGTLNPEWYDIPDEEDRFKYLWDTALAKTWGPYTGEERTVNPYYGNEETMGHGQGIGTMCYNKVHNMWGCPVVYVCIERRKFTINLSEWYALYPGEHPTHFSVTLTGQTPLVEGSTFYGRIVGPWCGGSVNFTSPIGDVLILRGTLHEREARPGRLPTYDLVYDFPEAWKDQESVEIVGEPNLDDKYWHVNDLSEITSYGYLYSGVMGQCPSGVWRYPAPSTFNFKFWKN